MGRVTHDKGVHTLLDAFESGRLGPRTRLLLIGPKEGDGFEERIARLGDRATWVPWTADVWGHLPALDVLCLPTLREGFGTVVLEAAAAGIPAITTDATGSVDTIVDGETGLLMGIGDVEALIGHVAALASDPDRFAALLTGPMLAADLGLSGGGRIARHQALGTWTPWVTALLAASPAAASVGPPEGRWGVRRPACAHRGRGVRRGGEADGRGGGGGRARRPGDGGAHR